MALIVQTVEGAWLPTNLAPAATSFDTTPTSGHSLAALVYTEDSTITGIASAGWTEILHVTGRAGLSDLFVFTKTAGATEPTLVETDTGTGVACIHLAEIAGTLDDSDLVSEGASNLTTFTGPTLTVTAGTALAGSILTAFIPAYQSYAVGGVSPNGSLVELYETYLAGNRNKAWLGYQEIASLGGTYQHSVDSTVRPSDNEPANTWAAVSLLYYDDVVPDPPPDPVPAVGIEWEDGIFTVETPYLVSWDIQRGAGAMVRETGYTGSCTLRLKNTADRFNPENAAGPLYGLLRDGPRVWIGVNADGTVTADPLKTVHGMFAGRITDITVIPEGGAETPPFVEIVCEDPLAWISRAQVSIAGAVGRSHKELRTAILAAAGETSLDLDHEPSTMPLSSADGLAGSLLEDLNRASGTRHFARPADNKEDWYHYVSVRRTSKLNGAADATVNAASQHVTGTSGWKRSAESVVNQQRATVEPTVFSPQSTTVYEADPLPIRVPVARGITMFVDFDDFVVDPLVDMTTSGGAVTAAITPFGYTAKLRLESASLIPPSPTVTRLEIEGSIARRGPAETVVIDDTASQAAPRGVRAGSEISGDYLGTIASADALARHIVWRYADPKYRPDLTVENWMPTQFSLDLFDLIAVTSSQIGVTARIFEIIGLTHHCELAADSAVRHSVTYQLIESRIQTATTWFTVSVSALDGAHELAY